MPPNDNSQRSLAPSSWVTRFAPLIPLSGTVLDVACGAGRHAQYLGELGHSVVALDRDVSKLNDLVTAPGMEIVEADLEQGAPWPLPGRQFHGIIVTNYLFRPLFPILVDALSEGGVLIYETFAAGNEQFGKPSNPAFLLKRGELLDTVRDKLRVIAFEDGLIEGDRQAVVQRICAVRPSDARPSRLL